MAEKTRKLIRRTTTAGIVVLLGGVSMLAVHRSRQLRPHVVEVGSDQLVGGDVHGGDEPVGVYHGFEFTESIAGKTVFVLRADKTLGLSSGWNDIEGVQLQLYRAGEQRATLTCDSARFNPQTRDAKLTGAVQLSFPDGGLVDTDRGRFDATSRRFVADSSVVYSSPQAIGEAQHATYDLTRDLVDLNGGVIMRQRNGPTLRTDHLSYDRDTKEVSFPVGVSLEGDTFRVRASEGRLTFSKEGGLPEHIDLRGGVQFDGSDPAGLDQMDGWADRIVADRDPGNVWHMTATTPGPWVRLESHAAAGSIISLSTWRLKAAIGDAGILHAECDGVTCMTEVPLEGPPRTGEARQAKLWFEGGRLTSLLLEQDVSLWADGTLGRGSRARFLSGEGKMVLAGQERGGERAVLVSGRSRMSADRVTFLDASREAYAEGSVNGVAAEAGLFAGAGTEQPPVRFAADTLHATQGGEELRLKGNARVWQGQRLLLADEIVFNQRSEDLQAFGNVRTTLPAQQMQPGSSSTDEVLVVARSLHYQRAARLAVYTGNVRYSDAAHILAASELRVTFADNDAVSMLEGSGQVSILDLAENRRMAGQHALYDSKKHTLTLTGKPVHLVDQKGNVITGASLTWDQASGTVTISGGAKAPSETVYHPEEKP